jgi:hypothetical protein
LFRCSLDELDELLISITTNGTQFIAQAPIGFEDSNSFKYSIFVSLGMVPAYGNETKEIIFCVIECDPSTKKQEPIWESLTLRKKISSRQHRDLIMRAICQCLECLIDEVSPKVLIMVTHTPYLPDKALKKYERILHTVAGKGYKVGKSDVWNGSYTWMMEQKT